MPQDQFNKFTKEAKQALIVAQEVAKKTGTSYVGTEHLLIGILSQKNSLGSSILQNFGVTLENVNLVLKTVGRTQTAQRNGKSPGGLSGFAKKVIEDAIKSASEFSHMFVGTEHLLFALVAQDNTAATVILENMKISPEDVRNEIVQTFDRMSQGGAATSTTGGAAPDASGMPSNMNPLEFFLNGLQGVLAGNPENGNKENTFDSKKKDGKSNTPALDYFTTDMLKEVQEGKMDPVIGRDKEIERAIAILLRKTKNNPVLIGDPGVGKTAVVEGLAQRIVNEDVPDAILDKKILSLSMASVVAGTKYRGEFEERIKQIIEEASSQSNVVLFIDELHTVIGAGSAEGSLDAANILKPALSRGKVQLIGATTTAEYRKHVEQDAALERRFQSIMVDEPSEEDTITILKGLREAFENHHNLIINDDAIESAVKYSKRYVNDRFLPDKAIDLIDEAAALKGMKVKPDNDKVKKFQRKLKKIVKQKETAVTDQNYELAADLRQQELQISDQVEEEKSIKIPREMRGSISSEDVAKVISRMTGVPVTKLVKEDIDKLKDLEKTMTKHVIGQEEAIKKVSTAIRRSRVGISSEKRPIASFIFLGPTGVGKTELVKTIAREVYSDEDALIKIDMSEFMERHNTSRLTGTTAGYVGYEEGGQLTEKVRRKPYSVILFDEIEKAHPDVFNLLLQILEDGVLTDGKGRKIDFTNTIIIMTSNIGARLLTESAASIGFQLSSDEMDTALENFDHKKEEVTKELKKSFKPEFLNRVDNVMVFQPLSHQSIKKIVAIHVRNLDERLDDKEITLDLTTEALDLLATLSTDPEYGARPVRRKVEELIEDPLAHGLLEGDFAEGDTIQIVKKGDQIVLKKKAPQAKRKTGIKKTAAKKTKKTK
ncbi:ATP-dependent Clp protease ATP-binding subunit [Candidatus Peregrinibacteria bacterium]|jgi:ATP-dependent Clp protease ATP-binding subunit ClpC|nr:ATP-dependent Clp protease ATP-binding subunit [Candidatus Peregrinibacteria bacterium]MBT4631950.1 ATP-dependent Clp protease ATP-binding subunit [Candidatus Peregrinibacteria bacterium]MBT5517149.1 ATP-dependent Clp protease ATP-binding subunit [Candidatus Peregrinibacteria bacterium]MBT5823662.1 ATP-dependent Clp protease ATP-binding subunit [Candidatus Peregrinibacteria bacterium]